MLLSIVWTALLMFVIDRDFFKVTVWALLGSLLSLFGLIHSDKVGFLIEEDQMGWKFCVGYAIVACVSLGFFYLQKFDLVEEKFQVRLTEQLLEETGEKKV